MWKMIFGQAIFQIIINFTLLFAGPHIFYNMFGTLKDNGGVLSKGPSPDVTPKTKDQENFEKEKKILKTMVFNTFVFLQIFNEINCRRIDNRLNVFSGIYKNAYFICIFFFIAIAQFFIVYFGGEAFKTERLDGYQWGICILLGFFSLPLGMIIRLIPDSVISACLPKAPQEAAPVDWTQPIPDFINPIPKAGTGISVNSLEKHQKARLNWDAALNALRQEPTLFGALHGGRSFRAMNGTTSPRVQTAVTGELNSPTSFAAAGRSMTAPTANITAKQRWKIAMAGVERQRRENMEV